MPIMDKILQALADVADLPDYIRREAVIVDRRFLEITVQRVSGAGVPVIEAGGEVDVPVIEADGEEERQILKHLYARGYQRRPGLEYAKPFGRSVLVFLIPDVQIEEKTDDPAPDTVSVQPARVVVRHPRRPQTVWYLSPAEATTLTQALTAAMAPRTPDFRQVFMDGLKEEPEVIYMRTGDGQPEPTSAVRVWKRVIPIAGLPDRIIRREDGRYLMAGSPEWKRAHQISGSVPFGWNSITRSTGAGWDVWMSTDE